MVPIVLGVLVLAIVGLFALILLRQNDSTAELTERAEIAEAEAATARAQVARVGAAQATSAELDAQRAAIERNRAAEAAQSAAAAAGVAARAASEARQEEPFAAYDTGTVNAAREGFLALRSGPSDSSALLVRIPDGAGIELGTCRTAADGIIRNTEWCRARYAGQTGWVYNAFVAYTNVD